MSWNINFFQHLHYTEKSFAQQPHGLLYHSKEWSKEPYNLKTTAAPLLGRLLYQKLRWIVSYTHGKTIVLLHLSVSAVVAPLWGNIHTKLRERLHQMTYKIDLTFRAATVPVSMAAVSSFFQSRGLEERIHKKGKGITLPSYTETTRSQTPMVTGDWQLVEWKRKELKEKNIKVHDAQKRKEGPDVLLVEADAHLLLQLGKLRVGWLRLKGSQWNS